MSDERCGMAVLVLLGVLLLGWTGLVFAGSEKSLMMVFTTDTNAELNPCG